MFKLAIPLGDEALTAGLVLASLDANLDTLDQFLPALARQLTVADAIASPSVAQDRPVG